MHTTKCLDHGELCESVGNQGSCYRCGLSNVLFGYITVSMLFFPTCDYVGRSVSYPSGTGSSGMDFSLVARESRRHFWWTVGCGLVDGRTLKDDCAKMLF